MKKLIEKIEQDQLDNKLHYDIAMSKPFSEVVYDFAMLIGKMQVQIEYIKNEIQNGI